MKLTKKNPVQSRNGFIAARASTIERSLAEQLLTRMGVDSQSELVRQLIIDKAIELGVS